MFLQLLSGGAVSLVNFMIHAVMSALIMVGTRHTARATDELHFVFRLIALLMVTAIALTLAHLAEITLWSVLFSLVGIDPPNGISVFEVAFENYTALGYGDVVPPPGVRLYGPMAALNGLLLIGWSVFILFDVMRMAEIRIGRVKRNR